MIKNHLQLQEWSYLQTNLDWLYEGAPQQLTGISVRSEFTLWRIDKGVVVIYRDSKQYKVRSGEWVILPPGRDYRDFSKRAQILSLVFTAHWLSGVALFGFNTPLIFNATETKKWEYIIRPMLRIVRQRFPKAYSRLRLQQIDYPAYTQLQHYLQELIQCIWPQIQKRGAIVHLSKTQNAQALSLKQMLDTHTLSTPFRLINLSHLVDLSPSQVNRIFIGQFGVTPKRYVEQRRLLNAQTALKTTDRQIKEISWDLGFKYSSLFTTWFRKKTGRSPQQFRSDYRRL